MLGDPIDFSDYIMFGGGTTGEIVVNSKQQGKIVMDENEEYLTGARLYFDAKRIAEDGLLVRDGCHLKVKDTNPSLLEMSIQIRYSPYYCSSRFHEITGMTFKSYISGRQLAMAALEIRDTNARILDIAIKYGYSSQEALTRAFKRHGVKNIQLAGPVAYARTLPNELLVKIMKDSRQRSDFLDFCHCYDSNPFVCGMGKDNLLVQGEL